MKTITLIIIMILVIFGLFPASGPKNIKYSKGKIFLQNNDTIDVYIKAASLYDMQSGIQYLDSAGNEHSFLPSKAKGFCLLYKDENMYFESRKDLKMVLFSSKKSRSTFIHRVSGGSLPLYYFVEKQLVMDGIDQVFADSPHYMILLDQEWISISSKYFVNDFRKLVSILMREYNAGQMKALLDEIIDGKYAFEDTPIVIERLKKSL